MWRRNTRRSWVIRRGLVLGVVLVSMISAALYPMHRVLAQQAQSSNYQVNEVYFGSGGELHACSATYCAKQAAGETAVGNPSSTNYQARAGFDTNREEYLIFIVNASSANLGVLSTGSAATTTGTFSVKSYLTTGYVVLNAANPPSSGGNSLTNLTSPTASSPGTEQFGINLKANTSPTTVGADPVQVPSGSFSFGAAATGYNTANQYKYVKGDTIASSTKSSGETDYTVTYLYNISTNTKAGQYVFNHDMVAVSTY
jgi:hypothetical protein